MNKIINFFKHRNSCIKELYAVDRIENGILILEHLSNSETLEYSSSDSFSEGDIVELTFDSKGEISEIKVDAEKTAERKKENSSKLKSLFDN
ncbi:MAG: DUF3006 domain-containing protein [Clostridia bacterium]|nr:DUF3006 domain-containing protein [Clostridia bacterium]